MNDDPDDDGFDVEPPTVPVMPETMRETIASSDRPTRDIRPLKRRQKQIVLMFGEMGSGKSHVARLVARDLGLAFVEGDDLISPAHREAAAGFKPLSREVVALSASMLARQVMLLADEHRYGVVVAQAMYSDADRSRIIEWWRSMGYAVVAGWIRCSRWETSRRLWSRPRGARWIAYWFASRPWFQDPTHEHEVYWNNHTLPAADGSDSRLVNHLTRGTRGAKKVKQ